MTGIRLFVMGMVLMLVSGPVMGGEKQASAQAKDTPKASVEEQLLGKWTFKKTVDERDLTVEVTFKKAGVMIVSFLDTDLEGTYKIVDDKLVTTLNYDGNDKTEEWKFKVNANKLEIENLRDGEKLIATRVNDKKID